MGYNAMPVHDIMSGKKMEAGEVITYFFYQRSKDVVDFKYGDLTLEDICYLEKVLQEAKDEILAQFMDPSGGPEGAVV